MNTICDIINCPDNIYHPVVMTRALGLPAFTKHETYPVKKNI